jgi:hypothetical protein
MRPTDFYKNSGIRLFNTETQMFLHLSGVGETRDEVYAWRGFGHQAQAMQERAEAKGDPWPYKKRKVRSIEP